MVSGIEIAARTLRKISSTSGKSRKKPRAAVALHHFFHRAAEVNIDDIEAEIFAGLGGNSAITCGSEPKSCAEMGCSSASKLNK